MRRRHARRLASLQFAAISSVIIALLLRENTSSLAQEQSTDSTQTQACAADNGGITLPPGFCASVFADHIGHARQMVVAPGGVYVNTWRAAITVMTLHRPADSWLRWNASALPSAACNMHVPLAFTPQRYRREQLATAFGNPLQGRFR